MNSHRSDKAELLEVKDRVSKSFQASDNQDQLLTMPRSEGVITSRFNKDLERLDETLSRYTSIGTENLTLSEKKILQLLMKGNSIEEIELRLLVDHTEMKKIITKLIERGYFSKSEKTSEILKSLESNTGVHTHSQMKYELTDAEILESLLESKMRPEIKKKIFNKVKNEEKTSRFLSSLEEWKKESEILFKKKN
jgi:DNA-binding MarR family transcriptional regulator